MTETRKIDKKGKSKPRKSLSADGDFIADLGTLDYFTRAPRAEPLVGVGSPSSSTPPSKPSTRRLLPLNLPRSGKPNRKPKPWRDIDDPVRALFYFEALASFGPSYALTLRLSKPVEELARREGPRCLDFLHRRVRASLKRIVGRSVEFCLSLEEIRRRLHLHGGIACADSEYKLVRRALKTAGGLWPKGMRQYQLVMRKSPTARWAGYAVKEAYKARPSFRRFIARSLFQLIQPHKVASFEGPAISSTHPLRARAKVLHSTAINEVMASRRATKVARRISSL